MPEENVTTVPAEEETHGNLFDIIIDFWVKGFNFLKYIFYDIFLGKAP